MTGRVQDRIAVVTGAASGLGEATARLLAAEGATVVLADIQDERGAAVAASLPGDHLYLHCDVTDEAQVARLVDTAVADVGRLDVMMVNAGIVGAHGAIDEIDMAEYDFTMAVLLRSVMLGMKHAARVMKPQQAGSIIATSSIAAVHGGLGPHVYAAAKAGVVGLTRNVAAELGAWNVRVNAIAPGKMVTEMNAASIVGDPDDLAATRLAFATRTPLRGRVGEATDVAHAALWLASDESGFVSGHTLVVDGGLSTGSRENVAPGGHGRWATRRELARENGRSGLPKD